MITPRLVMILASAGSGKTYKLTTRFIALLAAGAAPERIVALTFTRKAAGEFFDGILGKLAQAATDEARARDLARAISRPELRAADFRGLLRAMVDAMHRLRLGTLDSFFAQIARAFPFELGLTGDFEVLEAHLARRERLRVLQEMFAARAGQELADDQREFLEAFKRATFGTEEKQLGRRMDQFIDDFYERYLEAPAAELWGNPARIWPRGQPWLREVNAASAVHAARRWLATLTLTDGQRVRWEDFFAAVEQWSPGAPWSDPLDHLLRKLLEVWPALREGAGPEITVDRRKQRIDAAGCAVLVPLVGHVAGGELRRRLETVQGVHAVLQRYDAVYAALVRRAGRLTFADVERLLRPEAGAAQLSFGGAGDGRMLLDYRLDAGIDHWLLDEFQDTSRGQWSVLRNLIDEVVQDADGRRTFFCVGDVKQSIYGWREGDPTLMGDIRRHYNGDDDAAAPIATEPLDASWRSGPAVIAMVNAVFGAHEVIGTMFPGAGSQRWAKAWRAHTTERRTLDGQALLLQADGEGARAETTRQILQEIQPLARGLTCAVLVRRNDDAAALADYLRRVGGIPAVAESDLAVCTDQPVGAALLALVQAAAHPGDRFAWEHVRMTPVQAACEALGWRHEEAVVRGVLAQINAEGFERFAQEWMERLPLTGAFAQERARQFVQAAAQFDAGGRRDLDEFIEFMGSYVIREPESAAVVRVMTIHKSKGLGFDVVVLPELEGMKLNAARDGVAVHRDAHHAPQWVLELPVAALARQDDVLAAHLAAAEQEAAYEALSLLYVAMTRAKRAMYVITKPVSPKSTSNNYPKLLTQTLGDEAGPQRVGDLALQGSWASGNPDWFRSVQAKPATPREVGWATVTAAPVERHVARRPSGERSGAVAVAGLFTVSEHRGREFGTAVHALLAEVEWCAPAEIEARAAAWLAAGRAQAAVDAVVGVLRAPTLRALWEPVAGRCTEVWRERSFEVVLDGAWITGVFDRVVIERDATGRAVAANVFDFKTDTLGGAVDAAAVVRRHAAQLTLYRQVLARLTGLAPARVGAEIILVARAERLAVELDR